MKTEFDSLDEDANIYKLLGPVLLKQDKAEADRTVSGRLEFIEKEMYDSPPFKPDPIFWLIICAGYVYMRRREKSNG